MTACYGTTSWSLLTTDGHKTVLCFRWSNLYEKKPPKMIPTLSTIWPTALLGTFMWGTLTDWVPGSQWAQCHCPLLVSPLSSFLGPVQSLHLGHLPPTCPTMPGSKCFHIAQSLLSFFFFFLMQKPLNKRPQTMAESHHSWKEWSGKKDEILLNHRTCWHKKRPVRKA